MRRLALLLALITALGPSSLRWIHEATAHDHAAAREVACDGSHHHDHQATHGDDGHEPTAPSQDDDCEICGTLATLTPCEVPALELVLPVARPRFDASAPAEAEGPAPLAALRAMPPPVA
jgi:hypothetical protein